MHPAFWHDSFVNVSNVERSMDLPMHSETTPTHTKLVAKSFSFFSFLTENDVPT